jgi:hypothetical protein
MHEKKPEIDNCFIGKFLVVYFVSFNRRSLGALEGRQLSDSTAVWKMREYRNAFRKTMSHSSKITASQLLDEINVSF